MNILNYILLHLAGEVEPWSDKIYEHRCRFKASMLMTRHTKRHGSIAVPDKEEMRGLELFAYGYDGSEDDEHTITE